MDFGLAQLADRSKLTKTTTMLGTPAYMSPEQAQREPTDRRTDIWSLGVVLYEMVTGRLPFEGEREEAVLYGISNEEPEPVTALRAGLPMELEWIVGKALAKDRDERYQHAEDLLVDLRTLQKRLAAGRSTIQASPVGTQAAPKKLLLATAIATLAIAAFLAVSFVHLTEPAPDRPVRRFSFTPESLDSEHDDVRAAVSPDGRWIVYASEESPTALWIRALASEEPRRLEGTDGAVRGGFLVARQQVHRIPHRRATQEDRNSGRFSDRLMRPPRLCFRRRQLEPGRRGDYLQLRGERASAPRSVGRRWDGKGASRNPCQARRALRV